MATETKQKRSALWQVLVAYAKGDAEAPEVIAAVEKPPLAPDPKRKSTELTEDTDSTVKDGTWDEVTFAYFTGVISDAQYKELFDLYTG